MADTDKLYENNHAHRRDTQRPRTDKRTHIRTVRLVHTSRPVIAESVHAVHIDYGHHAQSVHDNNAYARPAGPHQSPASPLLPHIHTCHIRQALQNLLRLVRSILPTLGVVLSLLVRGIPVTNTPPRTLNRVSDPRGRVLCSKCHGEKRRRVPLLPMVRGTEYVRLKGQRYCPAVHRRIRYRTTICLVHESRGAKTIHMPTGRRQPTIRTFLAIQSGGSPSAHGNGPTQRRSSFLMLARLLCREETYSGPRHELRSNRYIRTVKLFHDGRRMYPTIRT